MQNVISIGNSQILITVNLVTLLIVFSVALIITVVALLYISMNVARITKLLEQNNSNQSSHKD